MSRPPLLSPANFALYDRVWGEAVSIGDRRYWPALDRLLDAARAEGAGAAEGAVYPPVAFLKEWTVDGAPRRRVDLTADLEVWLAKENPTVTPLYARPVAEGK